MDDRERTDQQERGKPSLVVDDRGNVVDVSGEYEIAVEVGSLRPVEDD